MKTPFCILLALVALSSTAFGSEETKKDVENQVEKEVPMSRFFQDFLHPFSHSPLHSLFSPSYLDHFLSREENPFLVPSYRMEDDPTKFQVSLKVDQFNKDDIKVELKAGGRILSMEGETYEETGDKDQKKTIKSKFYHSFVLNPSIEIDRITAQITPEGELVVTAPKHKQEQMTAKQIPITSMKIEHDEKGTKMK
jgi:HSP20 family molecular chaperone IbpA